MNKQQFLKKISYSLNNEIVSINHEAIENLNIQFNHNISQDEPLPSNIKTAKEAIWFALVFNSINHQFWDLKDNELIRYQHDGKVGAIAMQHSLKKFVEESSSLKDIQNKLPLTAQSIKSIFGDMPDPEERARILNQAFGEAGEKCAEVLLKAQDEKNTWSLPEASLVEQFLPLGYLDEFLKKSQLCLYVAANYLKKFEKNVEVITTCFADYQVPKVLHGLGILQYSENLQEKINGKKLIAPFSSEEKALRAATILACEEIAQKHQVSVPELDYWLWTQRNNFKEPFHLTKTVCY